LKLPKPFKTITWLGIESDKPTNSIMMRFAHLLYRIVISHNDLVAKKMLFFLLIFGIIACSKVQDQQIQPESVPEAIVALVGERVPGAVGVNFTPVIPRKIWMANAYYASTMHRFFVSRTQILEHYRGIAYLNNEGIQQIIQEASIGEYGFLTTPWVSEINKPGEIKYQSDFALDGERHLFTPVNSKFTFIPGFTINLKPRIMPIYLIRFKICYPPAILLKPL
jgi:hypothetical protein